MTTNTDAVTEWFTITAAAAYSGLSRTTIYRLINADELPVYSGPNGARRIKRDDLDALYGLED